MANALKNIMLINKNKRVFDNKFSNNKNKFVIFNA